MLTSFLWTVTELSKPSNWPSSETNTLACPGSSCEQCLWTCHASEQCSPGCQMFPSRPRLTHPPTDTYHRDLIHVGLVVQQESCTVQVVTLGCHVQRGQSILKKISHMVLFLCCFFFYTMAGNVQRVSPFWKKYSFPLVLWFYCSTTACQVQQKSFLKEQLPTVPWFNFSTPPGKHEAGVQSRNLP